MNELLASIMCCVLAAMTVAITLPMIDAYGSAVMYLLCAVLIWISYGCVVVPTKKQIDSLIIISVSGLYFLIRYGDQTRVGIDIGSSAVKNNNGKLSF